MKNSRIILFCSALIISSHIESIATGGGGLTTFSSSTQRTVLVEQFTNASCPPCAAENKVFDPKLLENLSQIAVIKYHVDWPGDDPMNAYNPGQSFTRKEYYDVQGVPFTTMDGVKFDAYNFSNDMVNNAAKKPAYFEINGADKKIGNNVNIFVSVKNLNAISSSEGANIKLFIVVTEEPILYTSQPGTNGETDFHFVMRKMLPDASGQSLGAKNANEVTNFNFSYVIDNTLKSNNLNTVIFIQNVSNKQILQALSYYSFRPTVELGSDIHICNDNPVELKITKPIFGGTPPYTFTWTPINGLTSPNDSITMADPVVNSKYYLTITDSAGTLSIDSIFIRKDVMPVSDFTITRGKGSKYVSYDASSSKNWNTCKWIFQDGTIANGDNSFTSVSKSYSSYGAYNVTLIVSSTCGTDTITKQVGVWGVGIEDEIASGNLKINAFSSSDDKITVSMDAQKPVELSLKFTNMLGQIIWEEKRAQFVAGKSTKIINAENLKSGIYYLQFISPDSSPYTMKVVKVE